MSADIINLGSRRRSKEPDPPQPDDAWAPERFVDPIVATALAQLPPLEAARFFMRLVYAFIRAASKIRSEEYGV
jgi:hypothetical protein